MKRLDDIIKAVGTILAVSVLIDECQRDQELIEFVHAMTTINQRIRPDVILPRQTILKWYESAKPEIVENIAKDDTNLWKTEILEVIEDVDLRRMVLAAMFAISVCDYELNDEECTFLKLAVKIWNTGLPHMDDMVQMAG